MFDFIKDNSLIDEQKIPVDRLLCINVATNSQLHEFLSKNVAKKIEVVSKVKEKFLTDYSYEAIFALVRSDLSGQSDLDFESFDQVLAENGLLFLAYSKHTSDSELHFFLTQLQKHNYQYNITPFSYELFSDNKNSDNDGSHIDGHLLTVVKPANDSMEALVHAFQEGAMEKYEYIRQMHHINRGLAFLSNRLKHTDIKSIQISDDGLLFTTRRDNFKLHFNGIDRRAAPFEIINFGSYESEEQELLQILTNDAEVILDIGANIGWYTIWFAKRVPKAEITAFEPIPYTYSYLLRNVEENSLKNIKTYNMGVGDSDRDAEFYFFPQGSIISSQKNLLDCKKSRIVECRMTTLDLFYSKNTLKNIDFIKCDVEGGEMHVLRGSTTVLTQCQPIIYTELYPGWCDKFGYHANDVLSFLNQYGYECFFPNETKLLRISDLDKQTDTERMNYFFLHTEKHKHLIKKLLEGDFESTLKHPRQAKLEMSSL